MNTPDLKDRRDAVFLFMYPFMKSFKNPEAFNL